MKSLIALLSCFICIQLFACCTKGSEVTRNAQEELNTDSMKLHITIGTRTFKATLYSNPTVAAFKTRLPLTISMKELNNNEKFFDLPNNLPTNASNPGTIETGDLMLYGSNTLVLFYKSFSTSYSYTRMGRIDDTTGLTAALGSGNVSVTFSLEKNR